MKLLVLAFGLVVAIFACSIVADVFSSAASAYEEHLEIARSTMD